jgi:hypothetical protein
MPDHIPHRYWNAAAALYAYLFSELSKMGVDVIGESQLVGYPSQFPSVSMVNYNNGKPNARSWVLKMIIDNFHPGDRLATTGPSGGEGEDQPYVQGFVTPHGRKILLVNRTNREETVTLPAGFEHAQFATVDEATGDDPPRTGGVTGSNLTLAPFAVTVVKTE